MHEPSSPPNLQRSQQRSQRPRRVATREHWLVVIVTNLWPMSHVWLGPSCCSNEISKLGSNSNKSFPYLQQLADNVRLLGVGRTVAVSVARHEVGARFHQLPMEHDAVFVLDVLGRCVYAGSTHRSRRWAAGSTAAATCSCATRQASAPSAAG